MTRFPDRLKDSHIQHIQREPWSWRGRAVASTVKCNLFEGCEKWLARASQSTGRCLHKTRSGCTSRAAFVGEGGIAIGIEKPLGGVERRDESVIKPATSIVNNELAVAPASKMRQFMNQNEGSKIVRDVLGEEAQSEANVPRRVVRTVLQRRFENTLGRSQRNLGVRRVHVERIDCAEHIEEFRLVHHKRHLRIGLEQVHAARTLARRIERVQTEMAFEPVFGNGSESRRIWPAGDDGCNVLNRAGKRSPYEGQAGRELCI